jgi:hypothetical protein
MQILLDAGSYDREDLSLICKPLLVALKVMIIGIAVLYLTDVKIL